MLHMSHRANSLHCGLLCIVVCCELSMTLSWPRMNGNSLIDKPFMLSSSLSFTNLALVHVVTHVFFFFFNSICFVWDLLIGVYCLHHALF